MVADFAVTRSRSRREADHRVSELILQASNAEAYAAG
jgi:hypothetical protein